jgi:hypothetical protein
VDRVVKTSRFNRTTGTFTIPARTTAVFVEYEQPQVRIGQLIEDVQSLVSEGTLNGTQGDSLIAKLDSAIQALDEGDTLAARFSLVAFGNEVFNLIRLGDLPSSKGLPLIIKTKDILWQIGAGA